MRSADVPCLQREPEPAMRPPGGGYSSAHGTPEAALEIELGVSQPEEIRWCSHPGSSRSRGLVLAAAGLLSLVVLLALYGPSLLGMKTSPLSTPPTALRSSPARFSHLHPRVSTAMGFLESCAEVGPDVPPVLSALLRPPDGGVGDVKSVARALDAYNASKTEGLTSGKVTFSCVPWVVPATASSHPTVGIVVVATNVSSEGTRLALQDKRQYAAKHGYGLHVIGEVVKGRHPAWTKLPAALSLLHRYDWVMCLDLDTVVMDHSVPLLDFLDPHADAVFSMDFWAINSGVFFLRSCSWTRLFLAEAWTLTHVKNSDIWWENAAFIHLIKTSYGVRNHVKIVPQEQFNTYPWMPHEESETFIMHFAGVKDKWDQIPLYYQRRRHVDGG